MSGPDSYCIPTTGPYRYTLFRRIPENDQALRVLWVMLNPSTADGVDDDPTIRRVLGFSKLWGFGCVEVVNLYGLRSTNPHELITNDDPTGVGNWGYIDCGADRATEVIAAWGNLGFDCKERERFRRKASCLGTNTNGEPKHPLYVASNTVRRIWT